MLDRTKILLELQTLSDKIYLGIDNEVDTACTLWQNMAQNNEQLLKFATMHTNLGLPTWQGNIDQQTTIESYKQDYQVLAIDGSQIYPDKHQGTPCFVINIGGVVLRYHPTRSTSTIWSEPFVFIENRLEEDTSTIIDVVNGKREEFEFQIGLERAILLQKEQPDIPLLFLFDGSLVFWHLYNKNSSVKDYFLERYNYFLEQLCAHNILCAGYLSMAKNKDLALLMEHYAADQHKKNNGGKPNIKHISDSTLARLFLQTGNRTGIFKSNSPVTQTTSAAIHPHFFYYDTGQEIARIEIPGYIAQDKKKVNLVASLIKNQIEKGQGYPVSLAEAHEQAVIKAGDRNLFYQMIDMLGIDKKKYLIPSQKSLKKRRMNI